MALTTATVLGLIASGVGAAGAIGEGQSGKSQAYFQARVSKQQANQQRELSAESERDFRKDQAAKLAEREAALGASGTQTNTGTALLSASDFAAETELNAQRIRRGGDVRATRLDQNADLLRKGGASALDRGYSRGGASLLSGIGSAFK